MKILMDDSLSSLSFQQPFLDEEFGVEVSWFLSSPFIIRVPFFLLVGFSKGALK